MIDTFHIIGCVGAGKTYFREKYFKDYPTFDIKRIYEETGYTVSDLRLSDGCFAHFLTLLRKYLSEQYDLAIKTEKALIVESSGINSNLNLYLKPLTPITILIQRTIPDSIYLERPYAQSLNDAINRALREDRVPYDAEFVGDTGKFRWYLADIMKKYPQLTLT